MDPVCMLTCYPQLLHSFVYKTSSLREAFSSLEGFANAVRIVFSRDLIISEVILCLSAQHLLPGGGSVQSPYPQPPTLHEIYYLKWLHNEPCMVELLSAPVVLLFENTGPA